MKGHGAIDPRLLGLVACVSKVEVGDVIERLLAGLLVESARVQQLGTVDGSTVARRTVETKRPLARQQTGRVPAELELVLVAAKVVGRRGPASPRPADVGGDAKVIDAPGTTRAARQRGEALRELHECEGERLVESKANAVARFRQRERHGEARQMMTRA